MKLRHAVALLTVSWFAAAIVGCAPQSTENQNQPASPQATLPQAAAQMPPVAQGKDMAECKELASATLSRRPDLQLPPKGCDCNEVSTVGPFKASSGNPNEAVYPIVNMPQGTVEVICLNNSSSMWLLPREYHRSCHGCEVVLRK